MSLSGLLISRRLVSALLVSSSLFIGQLAYAAPERFALVIGNTDYSGHFSPLQNPINDAQAMAKALKSLDFQVTLRPNLNFSTFHETLRTFAELLKAHPNNIALVYFSGHGLQGSDGKNYLIPINTAIDYHEDVAAQGIAIDKTLETLHFSAPKVTIFIVDACRSGVTLPSRDARKSGEIARTMNSMSGSAGSVIAFASSPGEYALDYLQDKNEKHSVYTAALLENLSRPDYDLFELFGKTREQVLIISE